MGLLLLLNPESGTPLILVLTATWGRWPICGEVYLFPSLMHTGFISLSERASDGDGC